MKKSIFVLILIIAFFITACVREDAKVLQDNLSNLDDYMTSVKEQSDRIKTFLERDALTQYDMNVKSQELYELWDDALNYLWSELKISMPEEEFEKLLDEQRIWVVEKERTIEEAGKEVEGGSLYPLIVNSVAARITEERVYELDKFLEKID